MGPVWSERWKRDSAPTYIRCRRVRKLIATFEILAWGSWGAGLVPPLKNIVSTAERKKKRKTMMVFGVLEWKFHEHFIAQKSYEHSLDSARDWCTRGMCWLNPIHNLTPGTYTVFSHYPRRSENPIARAPISDTLAKITCTKSGAARGPHLPQRTVKPLPRHISLAHVNWPKFWHPKYLLTLKLTSRNIIIEIHLLNQIANANWLIWCFYNNPRLLYMTFLDWNTNYGHVQP